MATFVSLIDITRDPAEFLARVENDGEHFVIMQGDVALAELRPVAARCVRLSEMAEMLASLPRLEAGDAEAFAREVEAARRELDAIPLDDPWRPPPR
ncbi:MAG TPA: hypothetical protein VEX86_16425 [Longimicrobium sp.]|nr:hypothetical protein [Longimicrobium sp.]